LPPDLAVEVLSPTNDDDEMRVKIANYLAVGTQVWVFDPDKERLEVYRPGQAPEILSGEDVLAASNVLPGFKLRLSRIFKKTKT
jgi:Uma2 family endonuclease